jgi:uncharacterized damage-inducible protein DinB
MSNRALASHLRRTVDGPMWHGPALMELLSTISMTQASARPIASAHTIAELVLHMTAWANIARERLHSANPVEPTPEQDWPSATGLDTGGWLDALARLRAAYDALANQVEALDEAALRVTVRGRDHSVETMLRGVVEHGVYHGGQVALLKRALESAPADR